MEYFLKKSKTEKDSCRGLYRAYAVCGFSILVDCGRSVAEELLESYRERNYRGLSDFDNYEMDQSRVKLLIRDEVEKLWIPRRHNKCHSCANELF